jgi:hypothetical protein
MGRKVGGDYVRRCLLLWKERYGERVAVLVRQKLARAWKEMA